MTSGEGTREAGTGRTRLPDGMRVERMSGERDLDGLMAVEHACFLNPSSREALEAEMRRSDVSRIYLLRHESGLVVGFCSSWLVFDELHVHSLGVLPEWRGQGLGSGMLTAVLEASVAEGARRATLEVRTSNDAARALYARLGFVQAGVRRGYYTNPPEDALILWLDPLPPAAPSDPATA